MKLNLGCHNWKLSGFTNVDIDPERRPDVVADVRSLPFDDESVDEIYAGHIIEHLSIEESALALNEWKRVLKPGGTITITVPDFEKAYDMYLSDRISLAFLNSVVFGDEIGGVMEHKQLFTTELLTDRMMSAKFSNIRILDVSECDYLVAKDKWQSIVTATKG